MMIAAAPAREGRATSMPEASERRCIGEARAASTAGRGYHMVILTRARLPSTWMSWDPRQS